MLLRIITPNACFGLYVHNGVVTNAPPIANWCKGRSLDDMLTYWNKRAGCTIETIDYSMPEIDFKKPAL